MDSTNNACQQIRLIVASKTGEIKEMRVNYIAMLDQLVALQTVNDKSTIMYRTMLSKMKETEPEVPIPKVHVEPGTIARGVKEQVSRAKTGEIL